MAAKVRILVSVAGDRFAWYPGDVVEMPDEEALKWADGVRGELVEDEPVAEKTAEVSRRRR